MLKGLHHLEGKLRSLSHSKQDEANGDDWQSVDADNSDDEELHSMLYNPQSSNKLSKILKRPEVDPNELNSSGNGCLHCLVKRELRHSEKVEILYTFLTESSVDVDLPDKSGNTALHLATEERDMELTKMLLAFGARINPLNKVKRTPLDVAIGKYAFHDCSKSLVEIFELPQNDCNSLEAMLEDLDDVGTLLKECGAMLGCQLRRSEQKKICRFVDCISEKEGAETEDTEPCQKVARKKCTSMEMGRVFFKLEGEISAMLEDTTNSLALGSLDKAAALGIQVREMKLLQMAGSRILCLDGGGVKGLVEIEILSQLEKQTGRKITELFDWILGTSTGAIIALGLVYAKMSIKEVRQLFYKIKDPAFDTRFLSTKSGTEKFTKILQQIFGSIKMDEVKYPKLLVSAVYKKTTNLKLHFFSNHEDINRFSKKVRGEDPAPVESGNNFVWEVARYTSAAPAYFDELHNYVDGGILANNPAASGLTVIQEMYRSMDQKLPISLVVSVGTGRMPDDKLGRTDAHQFMFLGKHWLNFKDTVISRGTNLLTLLGNAITESEQISDNVKSRCIEQGVDYFRLSPNLDVDEIIDAGETDSSKLIDMVVTARKCSIARKKIEDIEERFPRYSDANQKMLKQLQLQKT